LSTSEPPSLINILKTYNSNECSQNAICQLLGILPRIADYDLFDFTPTLFPALNLGKTMDALRLLLLLFSTRKLLFDGTVVFGAPSISISSNL